MTDQTAVTPARKHRESVRPTRQRQLVFLGALIVFTTFIVKDILREQLKELVDSIGQAEQLYMIQSDINEILAQFRPLPDEVATAQASVSVAQVASTHDLLLRNAQQLSTVLSSKDRNEFDKWRMDYRRRFIDFLEQNKLGSSDTMPLKDAVAFSLMVDDIVHDTLRMADEKRLFDEHTYKLFTWISYALYIFGWGIALRGRLIGVETCAEE